MQQSYSTYSILYSLVPHPKQAPPFRYICITPYPKVQVLFKRFTNRFTHNLRRNLAEALSAQSVAHDKAPQLIRICVTYIIFIVLRPPLFVSDTALINFYPTFIDFRFLLHCFQNQLYFLNFQHYLYFPYYRYQCLSKN